MGASSDDEFDHVRDFDLSDYESEAESVEHDTPSTTPPRRQTPRPADRKIIACPYHDCEKTFNRNARLQEHIRSHTGERPFKCTEPGCEKAFLRDSHFKHHLTSAHSSVRKYKCTWEACTKSFATGTRLRRHVQSHEGKEKHRCRGYEGCTDTFRKHETLRKHIATVHEQKKPFPCDHTDLNTNASCAQSFDSADKLKTHQRSMHDDTRFSCTVCLSSLLAEAAHLDIWQEADSHPFTFESFLGLQSHIATVHPPTCQYCPTSFKTNKELTRHLELQHGIGDFSRVESHFPCSYQGCSQVFSKRGNLNVHVKTVHERKRDFVCGTTPVPLPTEVEDWSKLPLRGCGRSFTSKASLIEHVRVAHYNLLSKRAQREETKKAKRAAEDDLALSTDTKRRNPRKDKGIKKTSTLSTLSGLNISIDPSVDVPNIAPYNLTNGHIDGQGQTNYQDLVELSDAENDDFDQLSGSMTMCGDHLYHNGHGYHLTSEDGSADQSKLDQVQYMPCDETAIEFDSIHDPDTAPFFEFELEKQHLQHNLDPLLLHV